MTFDDARTKLLAELDARWARLRAVIADPGWMNLAFKEYVLAVTALTSKAQEIAQLNHFADEVRK